VAVAVAARTNRMEKQDRQIMPQVVVAVEMDRRVDHLVQVILEEILEDLVVLVVVMVVLVAAVDPVALVEMLLIREHPQKLQVMVVLEHKHHQHSEIPILQLV
tara:strand:- start:299 stop:607 length:309 start_codon:yes stop_codon:yes gene_type:complete